MSSNLFVYDPTTTDSLSKVRGIGRYLQTLKEVLPKDASFTSDLTKVSFDSIFINPFINLVQPPVVTRRLAKMQVGIIHDVIPLQFPTHFPIGLRGKLNLWKHKRALKNYDLIITDSETSKTNIINKLGVKSDVLRVIYPGLPRIFTNSKHEARNTKQTTNSNLKNSDLFRISDFEFRNYFIYVGDVTWNKNLVNLAKAIKLADITCVFVGKTFVDTVPVNDWTKELHEFIRLTKDNGLFNFPGFVSDDDLKKLYKNAVGNILVSREEGFGFSYVEAATQKTPSILSDINIFHETADDTALFVNPEHPEDIARAIKELAENTELRTTLGQKAFVRWQSLFESTARWEDLSNLLQTPQSI